jgi:hypothetical protein
MLSGMFEVKTEFIAALIAPARAAEFVENVEDENFHKFGSRFAGPVLTGGFIAGFTGLEGPEWRIWFDQVGFTSACHYNVGAA